MRRAFGDRGRIDRLCDERPTLYFQDFSDRIFLQHADGPGHRRRTRGWQLQPEVMLVSRGRGEERATVGGRGWGSRVSTEVVLPRGRELGG